MVRKNKLVKGISLALASLILASCGGQPPVPSGPQTTSRQQSTSQPTGLSTPPAASQAESQAESQPTGLSTPAATSEVSSVSESSQESIPEVSSAAEASAVAPSGAHGPDGSTAVSWYLCGSGSLWDSTGWTIAGGVQLFSNPASETDKGCILNIAIAVDDQFKVTDGTSWYGYDKVDQWDDPSNAGKNCFEAQNDGYGGSNIKCTVAGTYDIYVNKDGKFWIQAAA